MTKKERIELYINAANSIPTLRDKGMHENTVSHHVSIAYNQILGDLIAKTGFKNLSLYTKLCTGDGTGIDVLLNPNTGVYYSILPYDISPLTDVRSGVRIISPMDDDSIEFPPLERNMVSVRQNSLAAQATSTIYNTIGIDNIGNITVDYIGMVSNNFISKVKMYLLLPFEAFDEDDTIHIPAGQDKVMYDMVMSTLQGIKIKDMVNIYKNGQ